MKHTKQLFLFTLAMAGMISLAVAQQHPGKILGPVEHFKSSLRQQLDHAKTGRQDEGVLLEVQLPDASSLKLDVKFQSTATDRFFITGEVAGYGKSSFFIGIEGSRLRGNIILSAQREAYEYTVDSQGQVVISETDIDKVICVEYPAGASTRAGNRTEEAQAILNVYDLQSLPGAYACVFLDFDGYTLPPGTGWMNGNSFNAPPSGMSDAQVQEAWDLISEDYRPFNVNITTSQAVFNSYPQNRRQRCVFTPDDAPSPGNGGVAFVEGFGYQDWPCWVFILDGKAGGEAASHEIGHTLGLGHDGRTNPNEGYFAGHGNWAPIMGVGYYRSITQWSRGEYAYANNTEDDLSVMAGYVGFRGDDHGNDFGSATYISSNGSGNIDLQYGVIQTTGDRDFFSFTCGTGNVSMDINTVARHGDLDVLVRLYEGSSGNQIGVFNGSGLNTHMDAYLGAGTYYLSVDGTGAGNPATDGYSDYASLGSFWISGTITPGAGGGAVTLYEHCYYDGYAISLGEGSYTLSQLQAMGLANDDISSIRVQPGYSATLYWDDDFLGSSLVKTGDDNCLVDEIFNDEMSSILISRTATVIEAESYSAMAGVQLESCAEGGQNVGWIDQGDWMAYNNVHFPTSGNYLVEYRVASATGGGRLSIDLNAGAIVLGERDIPATGDWQGWTTVSHTVSVNAGTYPVGIFAQAGGWNLNWFRITQQGTGASAAVPAEQSAALKPDATPSLTLYPNPAGSKLELKLRPEWSESRVMIVDLQGNRVWEGRFSEQEVQSVNVSELNAGVYSLLITKNGKTIQQQFIKK